MVQYPENGFTITNFRQALKIETGCCLGTDPRCTYWQHPASVANSDINAIQRPSLF